MQGYSEMVREGEVSCLPLGGLVSTGARHPQQSRARESSAPGGAGLSCRFQAFETTVKMPSTGVSVGQGDEKGKPKGAACMFCRSNM